MRSERLLRFVGAAMVSAVIASFYLPLGCGPACATRERVFTGGTVRSTGGVTVYETNPSNGAFLPFEGATFLHVKHRLGVRPDFVDIELSFNEATEVQGGGGSSKAAGNQALLLKRDADEIILKNDSCANYYVRVTALAVQGGGPPVVPDAGSD